MRVRASPTISFRAVRVHSEQSISPVIYFERRRVRAVFGAFAAFALVVVAFAFVAVAM